MRPSTRATFNSSRSSCNHSAWTAAVAVAAVASPRTRATRAVAVRPNARPTSSTWTLRTRSAWTPPRFTWPCGTITKRSPYVWCRPAPIPTSRWTTWPLSKWSKRPAMRSSTNCYSSTLAWTRHDSLQLDRKKKKTSFSLTYYANLELKEINYDIKYNVLLFFCYSL